MIEKQAAHSVAPGRPDHGAEGYRKARTPDVNAPAHNISQSSRNFVPEGRPGGAADQGDTAGFKNEIEDWTAHSISEAHHTRRTQ